MGRCCWVEMGPQAERIKSISIYGRGSDRGCWAPGGSSGILQLVAGKEAGKRWVLRTHVYSRIAFAHTRLSLSTCRWCVTRCELWSRSSSRPADWRSRLGGERMGSGSSIDEVKAFAGVG
jgi:hypothetical protein